jgi:predicted enzyme related to lactoylglutathione lyase
MKLLVNIDVDDLEKAIAFYSAALGLRLSRRLFLDSVAEMTGATATIYLLLKRGGTMPIAPLSITREYQRHWTPIHLDFAVDDLEPVVKRVVDAGGQLEGQIVSYDWGRLATMSDPFGHGFCVVELSPGD